ncbi:hypothetical protein LINPERHAP1_LOCUS31106, partial [Linum perenne]
MRLIIKKAANRRFIKVSLDSSAINELIFKQLTLSLVSIVVFNSKLSNWELNPSPFSLAVRLHLCF